MTIEINKACKLADERLEVAQSNLDLGLANDPRTATPLEASVAKMALTEMYSHRGDGFPTQYTHGSVVADHAETMWCALLTALRSPSPTREADHLRHVIDRDRYIVAACVGSIDKAISGYQWLLGEGRGSYEWDDDRFRDEFRHAIEAIEEAAKPLAHVGWDKTDCTRIEDRVEAARLAAREVLNKPIPKRQMIAADLGLPCPMCAALSPNPEPIVGQSGEEPRTIKCWTHEIRDPDCPKCRSETGGQHD